MIGKSELRFLSMETGKPTPQKKGRQNPANWIRVTVLNTIQMLFSKVLLEKLESYFRISE